MTEQSMYADVITTGDGEVISAFKINLARHTQRIKISKHLIWAVAHGHTVSIVPKSGDK